MKLWAVWWSSGEWDEYYRNDIVAICDDEDFARRLASTLQARHPQDDIAHEELTLNELLRGSEADHQACKL